MNPANQLDELSRRNFLANTANTAFGVTLGGAAASWFSSAEAAEAIKKSNGKAKHVIYLYMSGGMTHIDTFDPKPEAPVEYRGPIKAISTNVDGIQLGQHLEKTAKHADKMCLVRSMSSKQGAHAQGNYTVHTSYPVRSSITHPTLGSWAFNLSSPLNYLVSSLAIFVLFLTLWATFAVFSRRFRDLGYSPWLTLFYLTPYIGWLLVWIPCGFLPFKTSKRMKVRRRTVSSSSP